MQTYVLEHDWSILADAIRREVQRGGQVYYLHNRVDTIDRTAARIREMLGEEVQVATAHGKLSEQQLSAVMQGVSDGQTQVLVCTTIIETGIDIPNVNTLIIEDADHLGLAQLHQIRGRIGRGAAGLLPILLTAGERFCRKRRISACRRFGNSGVRLRFQNCHARSGDPRGRQYLGPEQSGFLMSVGYDMYLKLLEDAVLEEQGQEKRKERECTADLNVSANIPERYVASAEQRMDLYCRIAAIRSREDADDLMDELLDRYGDAPKSVLALLDVALLRAAAAKVGITEITQKEARVRFALGEVDLGSFRPCAV